MVKIAEQRGLHLICHRKYAGFLKWLKNVPGWDTVLLLADWREVKPIVEKLGGPLGCTFKTPLTSAFAALTDKAVLVI